MPCCCYYWSLYQLWCDQSLIWSTPSCPTMMWSCGWYHWCRFGCTLAGGIVIYPTSWWGNGIHLISVTSLASSWVLSSTTTLPMIPVAWRTSYTASNRRRSLWPTLTLLDLVVPSRIFVVPPSSWWWIVHSRTSSIGLSLWSCCWYERTPKPSWMSPESIHAETYISNSAATNLARVDSYHSLITQSIYQECWWRWLQHDSGILIDGLWFRYPLGWYMIYITLIVGGTELWCPSQNFVCREINLLCFDV